MCATVLAEVAVNVQMPVLLSLDVEEHNGFSEVIACIQLLKAKALECKLVPYFKEI